MNMQFPDAETVKRIRSQYPVGCRIVLDEMDDVQAPPVGSQGTVMGVDDTGSIMPAWDQGGSLNVVNGKDRCHKIATEDEARVTLDWYGKRQPEENARCPRCGDMMFGPKARHAVSRWADIIVCDSCGTQEALEQASLVPKRPLTEWAAVKLPQVGGGPWKR